MTSDAPRPESRDVLPHRNAKAFRYGAGGAFFR